MLRRVLLSFVEKIYDKNINYCIKGEKMIREEFGVVFHLSQTERNVGKEISRNV